MSGFYAAVPSLLEVCDCVSDLTLEWRIGGVWMIVGHLDDNSDAEADRAEFDRVGADRFRISCPTCARVYVIGGAE